MPPFIFADFLAQIPDQPVPLTLAFLAVAGVWAWRVIERRERTHQEQTRADALRRAALDRARMDAVARISAARTTTDDY